MLTESEPTACRSHYHVIRSLRVTHTRTLSRKKQSSSLFSKASSPWSWLDDPGTWMTRTVFTVCGNPVPAISLRLRLFRWRLVFHFRSVGFPSSSGRGLMRLIKCLFLLCGSLTEWTLVALVVDLWLFGLGFRLHFRFLFLNSISFGLIKRDHPATMFCLWLYCRQRRIYKVLLTLTGNSIPGEVLSRPSLA